MVETINPQSVIEKTLSCSKEEVHVLAREITEQVRTSPSILEALTPVLLRALSDCDDIDSQTKLLTFFFLIESEEKLLSGTENYLRNLATKHSYQGEFSSPFKRFISKRLTIAQDGARRLKIGKPADAQEVLRLLEDNSHFFLDLMDLQNYFSKHVSPSLALNGTWNPLCTQRFGLKGIAGLKYVYEHNENAEYRRLMKQQMSSEWTGFNRFTEEPWEIVRKIVKKDGNLLEVGSSIGIAALEIANLLQMTGSIVLVDSDPALRMADTARVIDYNDAEVKFIPLREAQVRMDALRKNRLVVALFGFDFTLPLDIEARKHIQKNAFTHCANTLVYLQPEKMFQAIFNCLESTDSEGGVIKLHNDPNLEHDPALHSLTMQKKSDKLTVLAHVIG